jgi:S-adenosylmethionine decarboxylase
MAFNDTLFQLGMDLTRSSTTQKEDLGTPSSRSTEVRKEFIERDGIKFAGTHLVIDVFGAKHLGDLDIVEAALKGCVEAAGASLLHSHLHHTVPGKGVSGVAVLRDGHISIHSWPDAGYAAFDVFLGGSVRAHTIVNVLKQAFSARDVVVKEHKRGEEIEQMDARLAHAKLEKAKRAPVVRMGRPAKARVQAA